MGSEKIAGILQALMRNRGSRKPLSEKIIEHRELVEKYHQAVEACEIELAGQAFEGFTFEPVGNPMIDVLEAIEGREPVRLKIAALAAYEMKNYSALKKASEFDDDISELVDHLESYGDMTDSDHQVFLKFALSEPEK